MNCCLAFMYSMAAWDRSLVLHHTHKKPLNFKQINQKNFKTLSFKKINIHIHHNKTLFII
jgi:hypothetical protein